MAAQERPPTPGAEHRIEPPSLAAISDAFGAPAGEPVRAQIWRAMWDAASQVVLVIDVGDDDFEAAPVTPEVEFADDTCVPLAPTGALSGPLVAWTSLRRRLPIRVLDVMLGEVSDDELRLVDDGRGVGAPIVSVLDERDQLRGIVIDRMEQLAEAHWLPEVAAAIDIGEALKSRKLTPGVVAPKLGVDPGVVVAFARGDRRPTPEQASVLAELLDVEPAGLTAAPELDRELAWALDRPRVRRRLAERGRAEGHENEAEWRLTVATQKLPLAARVTGPADPRRRWAGLVEAFLDER